MKQGHGDGAYYGDGDGDGYGLDWRYCDSDGGYGDGYGTYGLGTGDGSYRGGTHPMCFHTGDGTGNGDTKLDPKTPESELGLRLTVANCMSSDAVHDACLAFELIQGDTSK